MKYEILLIVDKNVNSSLFSLCENEDDIKRLVNSSNELIISENDLTYEGKKLKVNVNRLRRDDENESRAFILIIKLLEKESNEFNNRLQKELRKVLVTNGVLIEVLWDDLSFNLSKEAYPLIYQLENKMRRLISQFMIINIGIEWSKTSIPKGVTIKNESKGYNNQFLQQLDFCQLGDILFKKYSLFGEGSLIDYIEEIEDLDESVLEKIKEFVPKSNWDKYFNEIVKCEGTYLKKRWEKIYEYRCDIAHNVFINLNTYNDIVKDIEDVEPYIEQAIEKVNVIEISEVDKNTFTENMVNNANQLLGEFINQWKTFENITRNIYFDDKQYYKLHSNKIVIDELNKKLEFITKDELKELHELRRIRNEIIHNFKIDYSSNEIIQYINELQYINEKLLMSFKKENKWKDEIKKALISSNGESNLSYIYDYIEANSEKNKTENWKAIVRYTLQVNNDLFEHVERGRWKLINGNQNT